MARTQDFEMLNNALQYAGDSALKRRTLQQQQQQEMSRIALQQQLAKTAEARNEALGEHYTEMGNYNQGRNLISQQNADTKKTVADSQAGLNSAKSEALKKPWYVIDPASGNAYGIKGSATEAEAFFDSLHQQHPEANFQITTQAPVHKVQRPSPDGDPNKMLYLSDADAAKFDAKMAEVNRPRQGATDSVTEKIPANPGSEAVPAMPASNGFLGFGAKPAVPAVPAVPPSNEISVTRHVPRGTAPIPPPAAIQSNVDAQMSQLPDSGTPAPDLDYPAPPAGNSIAPAAPQPSSAPKGVRVRNKKTGQMGTRLPDGTIVPD